MSARTIVLCKWLLFFTLSIHTYVTKAQLSADFSATPAASCSPAVVRFSDLSKGNPAAWKWDLGNGTISFLRNPSVTYFTPGQYTIKLIVRNSAGADSITKAQYITIYSSPVVNFSASQTSGCFPLPVKFSDLSVAQSGTVTKWQWDFGDGVISGDSSAQHVYKSAGNFNVSLRITNSFGCVKSKTKSQYIQIRSGVISDYSIKTSNSCKAPATINFINNSKGVGILSYQWDFGDGSGSSLANPSHRYTVDGSYTVRLIAKSAAGCEDTLTKLKAIIFGNTNADFSIPAKVCLGSVVNIVNISKPLPASLVWNFGDGSKSTDTMPVKRYLSPGNYVVKMIADFGACLDSVSKPVTVLANPQTDFTADKRADCKVPFTVKFTSDVTGAISYLWIFGDGDSSAVKDAVHIYDSAGTYAVKLIAANAAGCSDTLIKPAFIKVELPHITVLNLPAKGCVPFFFDFENNVVSTEPVTNYHWDFGDGSTSSLAHPSHTFLLEGTYTIKVIITTISGCTDTVTYVDGITAGTKPVANFSAAPLDVCANLPVSFIDFSTGKIDKWYWQFGDGGTSNEQNPTHAYEDTGYFTITLIVMNNGCADTLKFDKYVHTKPPVAKFLIAYDCAIPMQRVFTDKSLGADTWLWNFGDSTSSAVRHPVHNYASTGSYIVTLLVTNAATGCSYTKRQAISVIDEKADFKVADTAVCKGSSINFSAFNINPANIASYFWNFGDGSSGTSPAGMVAHVYKLAGNYSVTLIITDLLGCKDTMIKSLYIHVYGPSAVFTSSVPGSCLNDTITFIDNSYSDGTHNIRQWIWDFGDKVTETLTGPPFKHSYATPGIYTVKLKVTDSRGCTDSMVRISVLTISKPIAGFKTKDTVSCPRKPVTFINISTGPNLTYLWNFGDSSTSTQANPVHQYSTTGVFTVSLSVIDKYGCTGFVVMSNYIKIVYPVAGFLVSDSIGNCPPLIVTFTNTSVNKITDSWDFGDGTTSSLSNPSHFYSIPGKYNAVLTVTSAGGCIEQMTKEITLKGPYGYLTYTGLTGCNPLTTGFKASTKNSTSTVWDFNDGTTLINQDSILSHLYTNPGIYIPRIIVSDSSGCQVPIIGTDTIIVFGIKADFINSSATLCDSGMVKFTDKSSSNDLIKSYSWSFGDGSISTLKDPVHTYKNSGLFYTKLIVTTRAGCQDSINLATPIKIVSSPKVAIASSSGACIPATLNFSATALVADTSALSWLWNFGNGDTSTLQHPPSQRYILANTYTIQLAVANSSGCITKVNKTIEAYPIPDVNIKATTNVCKGKPVNLLVTGAAKYNWSPVTKLSCINCSDPVARPDSSIEYLVKGTSNNGCVAYDSISLSVKVPFELQTSQADTLCAGRSTILYASGSETYSWTPVQGLANPLLASTVATPLQSTTYRVIAADIIGCFKDTGFVPIKVYPIPTVYAGEDKTLNVGKTVDLLPVISNDVTNVTWSPTSGMFRNNYPGITVKPTETIEYTVEVSNDGSCLARDRVTVYVLCDNANVFIPNTFSPNNDGTNDVFYPRGSGIFRIKDMKIFTRWGEVIFEKTNFYANDILSGWNGTFKNKQLPADVFVYTINIICDNNTILTYKGNVTLVR